MRRRKTLATWGGLALLVASTLPLGSQVVTAADHNDAPGTNNMDGDYAADLTDIYAWHADGRITVVLGFQGLQAAGTEPDYDPAVRYNIHIDNTADPLLRTADFAMNTNDNASDIDIRVKFGQNMLGEWGVQFENVPGAAGPVVGPVGETLTDGNAEMHAGLFEDPFFFDLEGFQMTLAALVDNAAAADVMFDNMRDGFAGTNIHAIVVEFDAADALGTNADNYLQIWATSERLR
jgi:hypothetical protein